MDKEDKENIDTKAIEEKALLSVKYFVVDRKISHNIYQKTTKSLRGNTDYNALFSAVDDPRWEVN